MNVSKLFILTALFFLLISCKKESNSFTLNYSIESISNYKLTVLLSSDKTFEITEDNLYFNKFERKSNPITTKGTLSESEFASLKKILQNSSLYDLEDTYGFDDKNENNLILSQILITNGQKEKNISINGLGHKLPKEITHLTSLINKLIIKYKKVPQKA